MTSFVYIMMYGWVFFTILLLQRLEVQRALLISIIGGILFLPMATISIPGLPDYTKTVAISLAVLLGLAFSQKKGTGKLWYKKSLDRVEEKKEEKEIPIQGDDPACDSI